MVWRVLLVALAVAAAAQAQAAGFLLPGHVAPAHYDLRLLYDIDVETNHSFYARADILITALKPTNKIVLHALNFEVANDKVSVKTEDNQPLTVNKVFKTDKHSFLTIELEQSLSKNENYTLTIPYYGNLVHALEGPYISTYVDKEDGVKQYLIATQFEAIAARKAFPCFDEPLYKATYTINIGHHRDYHAVSNMPLKSSSDINALEDVWSWNTIQKRFKKDKSQFVWDKFEKSVPMSSYLVAYVVSKFHHVVSPDMYNGVTFKIWARKDAIGQAEYASKTGPKVLAFYEKFFNVSFPLPKQDMFAIPDFSAGAMENWGLITYRENALLFDEKESSLTNKERIAEVIAHELAHQWFGNLVTMKWWQDLWLNEGFATYMASEGVEAVEPHWNSKNQFAIDNILAVLSLDALESSHPVSVPLDDPKNIGEIFDDISYKKGATLIRMMVLFLGEDIFRQGLHNYLTKHSYSNAEQDDLWAELTAVSQASSLRVPLKQVMDTWTTQTGYPLLTVHRDYNDNSVSVTQKRYLNLGARSTTAAAWWVPLRVQCQSERDSAPVKWLANHEGVSTEHRFGHSAKANEWILFNYDMIAPYRVTYDQRNWQLLSGALASQHASVPTTGRVQLLSDALTLAWSNHLDYDIALNLVNYLDKEEDYLPLMTALRQLGRIESVLKRTSDFGAFQKFMRKLIGSQYSRSGGLAKMRILNKDQLTSVKMQVMLSAWACRMRMPECEEHAIQMFQQWMDADQPDTNNPIPVDLRRQVYCVAVSRGSVAHWRFLFARLQRSNVAAARDQMQNALTCTREIWILVQYLEWAITENSEVRRQDAGRVIGSIASSSTGFYVAKEFIYTRIKDIYDAFHGQSRRMGYILKSLLSQFTTTMELEEFLAWKEKNKQYFEDVQMQVSQAVENAKVNIGWLEKNRKKVAEKLREFTA